MGVTAAKLSENTKKNGYQGNRMLKAAFWRINRKPILSESVRPPMLLQSYVNK